jgi:hypothetical protein
MSEAMLDAPIANRWSTIRMESIDFLNFMPADEVQKTNPGLSPLALISENSRHHSRFSLDPDPIQPMTEVI